MTTTKINQAVCESRENDKVVQTLNESQLKPEIVKAVQNGNIWGVYFKEDKIVAEDTWGNIHTNIIVSVEIDEKGRVRVNGEVADYENLNENLNLVGEYETAECGQLAIFRYKEGFIEFMIDGSFASGEEANYTTLSLDEVLDYYNQIQ